jgi:hypothetical protein
MDGTPSSDSTIMAPRTIAASTTPQVTSPSTATTPAGTSFNTSVSANLGVRPADRSSSSPIRPSTLTPKEQIHSSAITSDGDTYKSSLGVLRRPVASSTSISPAATKACNTSTTPSVNRQRLAFDLSSLHTTLSSATITPSTTSPFGMASTSQGLPSNFVRPAKKTSTVPVLSRTTATPSTLARQQITISKSLRKPGGVGGDFEMVSKPEIDDDEFDVVDDEGPSATNGTGDPNAAVDNIDAGWEDDE